MVNNAGVEVAATAPETSEEDCDLVMDMCVRGTLFGMKYAIPAIRESGGGSVVNMSSIAVLAGLSDGPLTARRRARGSSRRPARRR